MDYFKVNTAEIESFSLAHWPISLFVHFMIVVVGIWISQSLNKVMLQNKTTFISVKSAIRVDVVAMPKLTKKELKALPKYTPEEEKVVAKVEPKEVVRPAKVNDPFEKVFFKKKKEKKRRNFLSLLKNIGKRKIKNKKTDRPKLKKKKKKAAINTKVRRELKQLALAGNVLNKGTSIGGDQQVVDPTLFEKYALELRDHVRLNWKLPTFLSNKGHKCKIRLFLSKRGDLLKLEIHESSGVNEFDKNAMRAIEESSPFPEVPPQIHQRVVNGDLYLAFPLL